ncbi:MAG: OmpA family protein [Woeseia sp.]
MKTPTQSFRPLTRVLALIAVMSAVGCATAPMSPPGSAEVRAKLQLLHSDPNLNGRAPVEIREALAAVEDAETPSPRDAALGEHRVYIADRKVEIAMARASVRYAEAQREGLEMARVQTRLDARTREADRARLAVENARSDADTLREEIAITANDAEQKAAELKRQIEVLEAEATDRGLVLTLGNVLFATGKSELRTGSNTSLDKLVSFLNEYPDRSVVIEGHTDNVGSSELNQALSKNRADSVKAYLQGKGIQPRRLTTAGMGEGRPLAGNDSESGRQQNRRVEIVIENPTPVATTTAAK